MLNVSNATKQAYKDYGRSRQIEIKIYTNPVITLTNSDIALNTLSVEEILEPTENLTFTGCNASILKFKSINTLGDIEGKRVECKIQTDNTDVIPLFSGIIDSAKNTSYEQVSMNVVAYDALYNIKNLDYKSWYDALFVNREYVTMKELRDNFFTRVGIEQKTIVLPNDNMTIYKTVENQNLTGETILKCICQLNGRYGRIGRSGKFEYVDIKGYGLYPSMTLYPSPTLYPGTSIMDRIDSALYELDSISFEKYKVASIDGVQIIGKDNQVIASAGETTKINIFNISSNPFVYNKTQVELDEIAENLYLAITGCGFVPLKLKMIGLPYVECGDYFGVVVKDATLNTMILHRTISGEQALIDNIESKGNKYLPTFTPNTDDKIKEAIQKSRTVADEEIIAYDVAVRRMNDLAVRALGAYTDYEDLPTGGRIYYMSNMPIIKEGGVCHFDDLSIAYKITGDGFYVSRPVSSPGATRVWENGYDAQTGELLINVLYAIGIHADWIVAGLLKSANYAYTSGDYSTAGTMFDVANGVIKSKNFAIDENGVVHIANGAIIGGYATESELDAYATKTGLNTSGYTAINGGNITTGVITGPSNKFSINFNNGKVSMSDGDFTGSINMPNASSPLFKVTSDGNMTAKSGSIGNLTLGNGALYAYKTVYFLQNKTKTASSRNKQTKSLASFVPSTCGVVSNFYITLDYTVMTSYSRGMDAVLQRVYDDGSTLDLETRSMNTSGSGTISFNRSFTYSDANKYRVVIVFAKKSSGSYQQKVNCSVYVNNGVGTYLSNAGFVGKVEAPQAVIGGMTLEAESIDCLGSGNDGFTINSNSLILKNEGRTQLKYDEHLLVYSSADDSHTNITIHRNPNNETLLQDDGYYLIYNEGTPYTGYLYSGSDKRIKEDITDLDKELSKSLIENTITHKFKYKNADGHHYGVIAQEARELLDNLGETDAGLEYIVGSPQIPDQRNVRYDEYIPHLINYVKDLRAEIDTLKAEIKTLKGEN